MKIKGILITLFLIISINLYAGATSWEEIDIDNGLMMIDIKIGGIPAKALLDTGAEALAVNVDFLEKNNIGYKKGQKIILKGVFGEKKANIIRNINIELFDTEFPIKGALPFVGDDDIALIIGLPFFKNFIFQFDYPNQRMRMISRDSLDMKKLANVEMKHGTDKNSLVVKAYLENDDSINLLFDTGSNSGLVFDRHFAEKKGWLEKYSYAKGSATGINERIDTDILSIPEFKFGPFELEGVLVTVPESSISTNISKSDRRNTTVNKVRSNGTYQGILGYDVLKHFVITLDAKTARMHISASE